MGFEFTHRSGIEAQVRDIARDQIDKALQECGDSEIEFGALVHKLRRHCKKLRGLLRLTEPRFRHWKQEDRAFRDAASSLAGTRDAAVLVETFAHLTTLDRKREDGARMDAGQAAALTTWLEARVTPPPAGGDRQRFLEQFAGLFEAADERAGNWSLSGQGFERIGDGLADTYRRMRDGLAHAEAEQTAEALHDWRKDTKYHWHHVGLLHATAPDLLGPRRASLDRLGEMLGDHHNLAVLAETLAEHRDGASVLSAIAEQQAKLASDAFILGRQLVAEKPAMLRDRFEQYWSLLPEKG
jgi:hypothetical protein